MATFTVTTLDDAATGGDAYADSQISLREAIDLANSSDGADTITFNPELAGVITLTEGVIGISDEVTISGGGVITISGDVNGDDTLTAEGVTDLAATADAELDDNTQIFVASRDLTLEGLTVTGGRTAADNQDGGAFRASGDVTIIDSLIAGNSTAGSNSAGGAFKARGDVVITNSTISDNSVTGGRAVGGAFETYGDATITNSVISGNSASGTSAQGGAFKVYDNVVITNSTISDNSASGGGAEGGAFKVYETATITNSTFSGNSVEGTFASGGAFKLYEYSTITNSTISGNSSTGVFANSGAFLSYANVAVTDTIILGNVSGDDGGELTRIGNIIVLGQNIIGADNDAFDVSTVTGSGSAFNANPTFVFAETEDNNGVLAGVLGDNGGNVETIALLAVANNPALDASSAIGVDARGEVRAVDLIDIDNGGTSDVGAFELQANGVLPVRLQVTSAAMVEVAENGTIVQNLTAQGFANPDELIFSVLPGGDGALFVVDPATSALAFAAAPDFEAPADANGDNIHEVTIEVEDGSGLSASQMITVTVTDVNEAPVAETNAAETDEDQPLTGQLVASDADGDDLTFALSDGEDVFFGSLSLLADGSFTYTPNADFNGEDSFIYEVTDGQGGRTTQFLTLTVNPVNDAPIFDDATIGGVEDLPVDVALFADDVDLDDVMFAIAPDGGPSNGAATITATQRLIYTPAANFFGLDTVTVIASDGNGGQTAATITLDITSVNDAPTAEMLSIEVDQGTSFTGQLIGADVEGDALTFSIAPDLDPIEGEVVINPDGSFTYSVGDTLGVNDIFAFIVEDGQGQSALGAVSITLNDPSIGTASADTFAGDTGAEEFNGGGGNDTIVGGGGADSLAGGGGGDEIAGGGGKDLLQGNGGRDLLQGNGGRDTLEGGGGRDVLEGGGGRDLLEGGGGRDLLQGGGGRDTLDGGGGKDTLEGGGGGDEILGGRGSDILTGDGGNDMFIFARGNGRDVITDFQQNRDKIVVLDGAGSFDDLTILARGENVEIRIANTRVIVEADLVDNFTASDFIF